MFSIISFTNSRVYIAQSSIGLGGGGGGVPSSSSSYGSDNVPSSSSKSNAKKPFTGFED